MTSYNVWGSKGHGLNHLEGIFFMNVESVLHHGVKYVGVYLMAIFERYLHIKSEFLESYIGILPF